MGFRRWTLLLLLLVLQLAQGENRQPCEVKPEQKCDFVCDCRDCTDELTCGYSGPQEFACDFEQPDMCGWTVGSDKEVYKWERRQRGAVLPDSGPSSDYTTGTGSGWFMGVTAVRNDNTHTALMKSPLMQQSSSTCRLLIRYFIWDSGHGGFDVAPLWASILGADGEHAVVWRPESTSIRGWREATVFLGRNAAPFQVQLHSSRRHGRQGDVAIDQLQFRDCALPRPSQGGGAGCLPGWFACSRGGCVEPWQVCDGTDDCGDASDEGKCDTWFCDFENSTCGWDLRTISRLNWTLSSQADIFTSEPMRGPGRDHTKNSVSGNFVYLTKPDSWPTLKSDWSSFHSPLLEATTSSNPCTMVMYTHQFGPRCGGLSVLVAGEQIYPVWERGGALGDLWVRAEVNFVVNSTFQILFVGAIRDREYGGIGIDNIILSPGCRMASGRPPFPEWPKSPPQPCTNNLDLYCNFHIDCEKREDEAECGDFSYAKGSSGWTDTSIGSQGWMLTNNSGERCLSVVASPGQQLSEAQIRTPLLGPSGPGCSLSFSYQLVGKNPHIGDLYLSVVDSVLGRQAQPWEFGGRTSENSGDWSTHKVFIGARRNRFQLEFSARAKQLSNDSQIAVKDVHFISCHVDTIPSLPNGLWCNFEGDECGWYQDQTDNFDWKRLTGMDHTISEGSSMVVEMWDPSLRGLSGRLLSFPQPATTQRYCLAFYYKVYGPYTGGLNVKLLHEDGAEELLWARAGAHGNTWHEGMCSVSSPLNSYQLVFEAQRSAFDGLVAVDDITFVEGLCKLPRRCSFEGQVCSYGNTGTRPWIHQRAGSGKGPSTDHTLETDAGFYMIAYTGSKKLDDLSTLTSPVRSATTHTECVYFWYHTGGKNPGSLAVYVKPQSGERVQVFMNSIEQGEMWRHASANISSTGPFQVEFEARGAGGEGTYIAIDDVFFSTYSCPPKDAVCDFEYGLCGWSNTQSPSLDHLDWDVTSAALESRLPVPHEDHTLKHENGHFLFLPSTTRIPVSSRAWLLSPHLPPTGVSCLRFWLHCHGSFGKLRVLRLADGLQHELFVAKEGESSAWFRHDLNITSTEEFQIVFEGSTGTDGVMALDDIEFHEGSSCADVIKPLPPAPPSNSGAVAASIIVAVLLVASCAAILYIYLRVRDRAKAGEAEDRGPAGFSNEAYETSTTEAVSSDSPTRAHVDVVGFGDHIYDEVSNDRD